MASFHLSIKNGKKGTAATHAAYIARVGKFGKNQETPDLVALAHGNLPVWANEDPLYFFKMSDVGARANGAAYRELEVALPSELTREQQLKLAHEFVQQQVGDKPFMFAIHSPTASLGDVPQDHMHTMYSDRKPDGIERPPEQFFSRYNAAKPEVGGRKIESGGKAPAEMKDEIKVRRSNFADLQNQHLEKYGHAARVDARSNRERGIDKKPEKHLGAAAINKMTVEDKTQIKDDRKKSKSKTV